MQPTIQTATEKCHV